MSEDRPAYTTAQNNSNGLSQKEWLLIQRIRQALSSNADMMILEFTNGRFRWRMVGKREG